MRSVFKVCLFLYRSLLLLIIPFFLRSTIIVGAAGHVYKLKIEDYLFFMYIAATFILLTNINSQERKTEKTNISFNKIGVLLLVFLSLVYEVYSIIDNAKDFGGSGGDYIFIGALVLVVIITTIVFLGLVKYV